MSRSTASAGFPPAATKVDQEETICNISGEMGGFSKVTTELSLAEQTLRIEALAGRGASSCVFEVRDSQNRPWALKVGHSTAEAHRLAYEAERLIWIDSPLLANVVDAGRLPRALAWRTADGEEVSLPRAAPYLLMEWCEGQPLEAYECATAERVVTALGVLADVGLALADLHAVGVAHGDVKPANILVYRNHRGEPAARLVDLGMSESAQSSLPQGGTPRYLAPEVFDPRLSGDGRARDLFALALSVVEWFDPTLKEVPNARERVRSIRLPRELEELLRPLLDERPQVRPSARWLFRSASEAAGRDPAPPHERRQRALRRSYLAVRRDDWAEAARRRHAIISVAGDPGRWLNETVDLARKLALLRFESLDEQPLEVTELDSVRRVRWLAALVGPSGAHWPAPDSSSDAELAERLAQALDHVEPEALTLRHLTTGRYEVDAVSDRPLDIALALGEVGVSLRVLDAAERLVLRQQASPRLALALARVLRLRGETGRAISLLSRLGTPLAALELSELWRRIGDPLRAQRVLAELPSGSFTSSELSRVSALRARLILDQGDVDGCLEILSHAPESVQVLETRALAELQARRLEAAQSTLERAMVYAGTEEERARVLGAEGMLHHAMGDADRAQRRFEAAAEHAQRAGAVLEEATYLTGVAASASDCGSLGAALEAAERATLLFEYLGRPKDAARAALVKAAVYSSIGARAETERAVQETLRRAREAGDTRCLAYAHLAMVDVHPAATDEARQHAERAAQLLGDDSDADRVRAQTRCLDAGNQVDVPAIDALARSGRLPADVRLEWWGARAERAVEARDSSASGLLLELEALASESVPYAVKGKSLSRGVALALALGETDAARRLAAGACEAVRELRKRVPPELTGRLEALPWVALAQAPDQTGLLPEQLSDVERLVHALGRRDSLRPLLDQVLDALVLWTGVERGLLLLRAPGDRLVPRAARNLARADLTGEQLKLSNSLAERALAQREPVVAVDAAGELPEMHQSVHALRLRSVLAVPLMARGKALGVVYLDDRERRGAFGARELAWVKLVATLAAVAISDARDQLLLKRAARRAERAEAKLSERLAKREVELEVVERELAKTRGGRHTRYAYEAIIGESPALCQMLGLVDRVTASDVPLLLVGESGVGKELIARAIHDNGARAEGQFVGENCAAIPEGLLESTLFGHVRGAFTGAQRPRAGLFEVASGGTLFLDEIGEMSLNMQSKLLRVLQDGEVRPVGAERPKKVDVRVIAATHRDLMQMVREGRFREDLFYRLNVISITVPPLRERTGDVERLVQHFMKVHARGRRVALAPDALAALCGYAWPGNIRQLENEVRRFLVITDGRVEKSHLSAEVAGQQRRASSQELGLNVRRHVDALETELVRTALDKTGGNQTRAAELLGLSRFGLQKMMKRLEISPKRAPLRRVASELSDAE